MDFFSALFLYSPKAHLLAKGEMDGFAAIRLRQRLDEAVIGGSVSFTVDVSEVTFVDAGGLGTLVRLSNAVSRVGGDVTVVAANPRFLQVAAVAGLSTAFGLDLLPDQPARRLHSVPNGQYAS